MTPEHKFDPKDGPLLSPYEEMLRSREAGERTMERARKDPAFARQLLVDIGYFEMMAEAKAAAETTDGVSTTEDSSHPNGADSA